MRRVVITGLGAVTPLGVGVRRSWSRLLEGNCGIVSIKGRSQRFAELPSQVAGLVPGAADNDGEWSRAASKVSMDKRRMATFAQFAAVAAEEALGDAGWRPEQDEQLEATGICLGSGIGSLEDAYEASVAFRKGGYRRMSPLFIPRLLINLAAGHISMKYGFKGPNHSVTTACTTGAHAIGDASRFIMMGDADVMLAGGAESCIHPLAIAGFSRVRSLATSFNEEPLLASRPFDRDRCGFVIGEGAGVLVLEELVHAKARSAKIYAEIKGYGTSADAYHLTAPIKTGQGALAAMNRALRHAGISPQEVDYVNAHATSTMLGDAAENVAIKRLLLEGSGGRKASEINISSVKGAIGHLLGAAGAVEAIFTALAVKRNIMPPTLNVENLQEEFDCNYVPKVPQQRPIKVALSNSFGFGGTNASLCLTKFD